MSEDDPDITLTLAENVQCRCGEETNLVVRVGRVIHGGYWCPGCRRIWPYEEDLPG